MGDGTKKKKMVTITISPELNEAIKAIAENTGRTKKVAAEWLLQKGIKWYEQSHDRQLKELNSIWEGLTIEAQMYLVAVANSFLKVAPIARLARKLSNSDNERK
jgi:predicted transcriptional regulator